MGLLGSALTLPPILVGAAAIGYQSVEAAVGALRQDGRRDRDRQRRAPGPAPRVGRPRRAGGRGASSPTTSRTRPTISDARVRRAHPAPQRARGGLPLAAHARQPDPAGRRRGLLHRLPGGRPPRADAQPRQLLLPRGAGRLGGARHARRRPVRLPLPVRAEDRRPGRQPALRERPPRPGADPRRRPHRRGRHPQRQDHRAASRTELARLRPPGPRRDPRRGLLPDRGLRRPQRAASSRPARRRSPTRATPPRDRCARRTLASRPAGRCACSSTASATARAST